MKIKVLGNSCTWFTRPNTQFLINDELLIDTPQSSTKFMFGKVDFEKINYILITHFHSDHFADLHIIYDIILHRKNETKVILVGPKTILKRLVQLFKIFELGERKKKNVLKVFDVIEIKNGDNLNLGDYQIEAVEVKHNVDYPFGYIIKSQNCKKVIGFTGDTAMCDGLLKIIRKSDVIFLDCATTNINNNHLSTEEILMLQSKFKNKKFYGVHTTDEIREAYKDKISLPECQQNIIIR